jgi:hypothetical protein
VTDDDIHALPPRPPPLPKRRHWWPWLLAALLVLGLIAAGTLASALLGVVDSASHGFQVQIDGDSWNASPADIEAVRARLHQHWPAVLLVLTLVLATVFTLVAVIVPIAAIVGILSAAFGLAAALLVILGIVAVALSPLWLIGLLLWLALRRRPAK